MMKRILIVGCGYVGSKLAKAYLSEGAQVWALQRRPVAIPGVQNIIADVTSVTSENLPNVDVVFYLVSADEHTISSYQRAYSDGIKNLLSQLKLKNHPKVIFCSTTAVYGQNKSEFVDEDSATQPNDEFGKILLEGEKMTLMDPQNVVVRLGGIYGPGRTRILENVRQAQIKLSPEPVYTNRIHVEDCVGIFQFLANAKNHEAIYLGVDCEPVLYNDMLIWLAQRLGVDRPPVGEEIPQRLKVSNKRCINKKIQALGYQFVYPTFREGMDGILKRM